MSVMDIFEQWIIPSLTYLISKRRKDVEIIWNQVFNVPLVWLSGEGQGTSPPRSSLLPLSETFAPAKKPNIGPKIIETLA